MGHRLTLLVIRKGHLERQYSLNEKVSLRSPQVRHRITSFKQDESLGILKTQIHPHFSMYRPINRFSLKHKHNSLRHEHIICEPCMTSNPNIPWQVPIHLDQVQFLHDIKKECVLTTSQEITWRSCSPLSELQALVKEAEGMLPSYLLRWCRYTHSSILPASSSGLGSPPV